MLAVFDGLLDRIGSDAESRFSSRGEARFTVLEQDAISLARALGAEKPPEPGEPAPSYVRVAFDSSRAPTVGSYLVFCPDDGQTRVGCVLVVAACDIDLDVPGEPLKAGHALLATWRAEDIAGQA